MGILIRQEDETMGGDDPHTCHGEQEYRKYPLHCLSRIKTFCFSETGLSCEL